MRKLARGPYSCAVLSKKSRRLARNWRILPPTNVPFGPGGSPDLIDRVIGLTMQTGCWITRERTLRDRLPISAESALGSGRREVARYCGARLGRKRVIRE